MSGLYDLYDLSDMCTFAICIIFSGGLIYFLALSAAGHARSPPIRYDACLDPGRAPWHVFWTLKVVEASRFSIGCVPRRRAAQGP